MKSEKVKNEKWRKLYKPSTFTLFDSYLHDAVNKEVEEWERVERDQSKTTSREDGVIITRPITNDEYVSPTTTREDLFLVFLLIIKGLLYPFKITSDIITGK